ncbi:MAG: hypothetical protein IJF92_05475 [Bacilli bacterium]|nr:hypothetical protein [Bacilli bacterium]
MKIKKELRDKLFNLRRDMEYARMAHDFEKYYELKEELKEFKREMAKEMINEIKEKERGGIKK